MTQAKLTIKDIDVKVHGTHRQHKILVYMPLLWPLSYANEWLGTRTSYNTAYQYAKVLLRFCNYLVAQLFNKDEDQDMLLEFWRFVNIDTLTAWKTYRMETRDRARKPDGSRVASPSNGTIDADSMVVCDFLDWVRNDMHVHTRWDGGRKKIKSAADLGLLKGVAARSDIEVVSANINVFFSPDTGDGMPAPIDALVKRRQGDPGEYLYGDQMPQLVKAFPDQVYSYIALTGYLVGVRPHEALAIPYHHVDPETNLVFSGDPGYLESCLHECPSDKRESVEMQLRVLGKGEKIRTVNFPANGWLEIMKYWNPLYTKRKALYKKKYGEECPLWILWLAKDGTPLYCPPGEYKKHEASLKKLWDAFYNVSSRRKNSLKKIFHHDVTYYTMRHTFATNFMVNIMKTRRERDASSYLSDITLQRRLADQMGHDEFDTTFKHYIDNAIAIMLVSDKGQTPRKFFTVESLAQYGSGKTRSRHLHDKAKNSTGSQRVVAGRK